MSTDQRPDCDRYCMAPFGSHHERCPAAADRAKAAEVTCADCGSPHVNHWKSWNEAGQWVCDDCWPDDPDGDVAQDGDW